MGKDDLCPRMSVSVETCLTLRKTRGLNRILENDSAFERMAAVERGARVSGCAGGRASTREEAISHVLPSSSAPEEYCRASRG